MTKLYKLFFEWKIIIVKKPLKLSGLTKLIS